MISIYDIQSVLLMLIIHELLTVTLSSPLCALCKYVTRSIYPTLCAPVADPVIIASSMCCNDTMHFKSFSGCDW